MPADLRGANSSNPAMLEQFGTTSHLLPVMNLFAGLPGAVKAKHVLTAYW